MVQLVRRVCNRREAHAEDRGSPAPAAPPDVGETATAPTPTRAPEEEEAAWRAVQHARIDAARLEGRAALARGDFGLARARFEEGFRVAQDLLARTDEDGDANLGAAVMLIELADLARKRGDERAMTERRRGADVLLRLAKALGVTDQPLLDATLARAHEMADRRRDRRRLRRQSNVHLRRSRCSTARAARDRELGRPAGSMNFRDAGRIPRGPRAMGGRRDGFAGDAFAREDMGPSTVPWAGWRFARWIALLWMSSIARDPCR